METIKVSQVNSRTEQIVSFKWYKAIDRNEC